MTRTTAQRCRATALAGAISLLAACGGSDEPDATARTNGETSHEIEANGCDPIRGAGTITNRAGEPAAYRVTVSYRYRSEDPPALRSETTPVLADGEAFDFSVGPDPTRGSPSSCRIVGADRVEAGEADVTDVIRREEAEPDGERGAATVAPLWSTAGIGGSLQAVATHDSVGYMASDLPRGGAVYAVAMATGELLWEVESQLRFDLLTADGRGGLLAASGSALVAFDDAGVERWTSVPLRRAEGAPAGSVERVALYGDVVIVGGTSPAAAAGIDLGTGEPRWHLAADEALAEEPTGFTGAADLVRVTDHGVLVAGGVPSRRSLALLDVRGPTPAVRWSVADVGTNASTDGTVVVDAAGDTVAAWDVASGAPLWSISDEDWERAPAAGAPAIVGDVVIVQRPNSTIAYDVATGEQAWEDTDLSTYWAFLGSDLRHDDRVFGQVSTTSFVTMGADGSVTEIDVDADVRGTVSDAAVTDGRVLLAVHGSTPAQGSTAFVLDLGALD